MFRREGVSMAGVAALLAIGFIVGCGSSNSAGGGEQAGETGPIKIGVEISQTGPYASLAVVSLQGIKFTVDTINQRGGLDVGGQKRKVELVVRDDASNPDTARAVVQQLITKDKVAAVLAGVGSPVVSPALIVAERYGVPAITTWAYSPDVLPDNAKFSYVNVPSTVDQFNSSLALIKSRGIDEVALVGTNDNIGKDFLEHVPEKAEAQGLKVSTTETVEANTTDFAPVMERLKRIRARAIIIEAGPAIAYQFRVAQARYRACGFEVTHYENGPGLQPDWVDSTKKAGIGAVGQSYYLASQKGGEDKWFGDNAGFVKAFTEKYDKAPTWASVQGVQSAELMALAIEKAGSSDRDAIAEALPQLTGSTLMGSIKFEEGFNVGFADQVPVVQQQGPRVEDAVVVAPEEVATAELKPDTCG